METIKERAEEFAQNFEIILKDRDDGILFGHWESDFRKVMEE